MVSLFLLLFLAPSSLSQWISSPQLDCRRVHPSFCCTSRIRSICPRECSTIPCGPEYYQRLFSTDFTAGTSARDGSAGRIEQVHIDEPREAVVVDATPFAPPTVTTPIPAITKFPTLIPFEPNIDGIPVEDKDAVWTTPPPTQAPITPPPPPPKKGGRTPDPRIIRPPDETLVLIGDYEDGDGHTSVVSNTGSVTVPSTFIEKQDSVSVLSRSLPSTADGWNGETALTGAVVKTVENGAVDGVAARKKDLANGISSLLSQFKITPSETKPSTGLQSGSVSIGRPDPGFLPLRPPMPPAPQPSQPWQQTPAPWRPNTPWQPTPAPSWHQSPAPQQPWSGPPVPQPRTAWQTPGPAPQPWPQPTPPPAAWQTPAPQCGIAPQFAPCVSAQVASSKLLACCRQKNLPVGCQALCRYDITQAEVRAALDRGQCGLLHVAPFLECAAQGRDNSECCALRGVAQKTGPQCLQFCRPNLGLTGLGLQHVVCGSAIGAMLSCHHSGIRP